MNSRRIKVAWVCHVQNPLLRERIPVGVSRIEHIVRRIIHKPEITSCPDVAQWTTNAIKEMEAFQDEVELFVISPGYALKYKYFEFSNNGVHYCLYRNEDYEFGTIIRNKLLHNRFRSKYNNNRHRIQHYLEEIKPDIVHLIGVENQFYSLSLLDVSKDVPTIAQLTALLNDPEFFSHFFMSKEEYDYRARIERDVINRADFIGTAATKFIPIIKEVIKPNAIILNTTLALAEDIQLYEGEKEYDFVYFAVNISKAIDLALDAFVEASKVKPGITLDVIGGCPEDLKARINEVLSRYSLTSQVSFEGKLPTHEDVIGQIKKARFALLPLKIDLTSGTIREAMANGLPVITTDTGELGTRLLNSTHETVLLSPIGDRRELAKNMIRLLEDENLADTLRGNAFAYSLKRKTNKEVVFDYIQAYRACIDNFKQGEPIPDSLLALQ